MVIIWVGELIFMSKEMNGHSLRVFKAVFLEWFNRYPVSGHFSRFSGLLRSIPYVLLVMCGNMGAQKLHNQKVY